MSETRKAGVELFVSKGDAARSEIKQTGEEIRKVGEETERTNQRARIAADGFNSSSRTAAAALGTQSAAATGTAKSMQQLDTEIAQAQRAMALWRQEIVAAEATENTDKVVLEGLRGEYRALGAEIGVLRAERRLLAVETATATAEERAAAAATQQAAAAQAELTAANVVGAEASSLSTRQSIAAAVAAAKLGDVAVVGGRQIGVLAGALGSASLPQLALLIGAGLLVGELFKLFKSGQDNIQITKAMVESDLLLANVFARLAAAGGDVDGSIQKQSEAYKKLEAVNLSSLLTTYVSQYRQYAEARDKATSADEEAHRWQQALGEQQKSNIIVADEWGRTTANAAAMQKVFSDRTAEQRGELGKHEEKLKSTTEALIFLYHAGVINEQQLYAQVRAAGADANALAHLRGQIEAATSAQEQLNAAVQNFHPVALDTKAQEAIVEKMRQDIVIMRNQGATLGQLAPKLKDLREESAKLAVEQASGHGTILKYNEAHEATRKVMAGNYESILPLADAIGVYDTNVKTATQDTEKHAGAHNKGAAAARAYSNALVDLTKRANEAEAALGGDTFGNREAKIQEEAAATRAHLEINKRDRIAALAEVDRLERAQIAGIAQARIEAERAVYDKIRQLEINGIADEQTRRLAQIDFDVNQEERRLKKEFGDTIETQRLIIAFHGALIQDFNRWEEEQSLKHWQHQRQVRLDEEKKFYDEQRKLAIARGRDSRAEEQNKYASVGRKVGIDILNANPTQLKLVEDLVHKMDAMGISLRQLEGGFKSDQQAAQQFELRLKAIKAAADGHPFKALALEARALAEEMRNSQTDAERWLSYLSNAVNQLGSNIEQGFEGLVNGTTTFAQVMKKIIFDLIASMAEQWGAYYLALGIADIFWNPALGAAELAAGAALMALAGVLHALGGAGSSKAATGGASAGAATGGGSSTVATGGNTVVHQPQPIIIDLSSVSRQQSGLSSASPHVQSSAKSQGPTVVHVHLDSNGTKQFHKDMYNGHGVLTTSNMTDMNYNRLKAVVKKMVKN